MTASFWYTAWVNAGMPDINEVNKSELLQKEIADSLTLLKTTNVTNIFLKGHDD
jgi:hypothetical protein